jgi:hypothetical protein
VASLGRGVTAVLRRMRRSVRTANAPSATQGRRSA